jgi:hypothetical protein
LPIYILQKEGWFDRSPVQIFFKTSTASMEYKNASQEFPNVEGLAVYVDTDTVILEDISHLVDWAKRNFTGDQWFGMTYTGMTYSSGVLVCNVTKWKGNARFNTHI